MDHHNCPIQDYQSPMQLLQCLAIDTWDRIDFSRRILGYKIYETSITQNIIYGILKAVEQNENLPILVQEAVDETANGNDIECIVERSNGYVKYPIQAKIIYKNSKYEQIKHTVNGRAQIDLLINYAREIEGIPLYLLYNSTNDNSVISDLTSIENQPKHYGISFVPAEYILSEFCRARIDKNGNSAWKIPKFEDLHPSPALAFYRILGEYGIDSPDSNDPPGGGKFPKFEDFEPRIYSEKEILEDPLWRDLTMRAGIGKLPIQKKSLINMNSPNYIPKFNPKFRLIFPKKGKSIKISHIS